MLILRRLLVQEMLELTDLTDLKGKDVGIIGAGCSGIIFSMYARHLEAAVVIFNRGEMPRKFASDRKRSGSA